MFFVNKNILLISPEGWDYLFVSKHHYAIELSKSNQVYFLNPPGKFSRISKTDYSNLWTIDYKPFPKGLRFFPSFLIRFFIKLKFDGFQKLTDKRFDIIWSFDNSVFFDFSGLPKQLLKISHIVDYAQNFQFAKAASTANVCFGVSQNIVDRLRIHNRNSFLVPHGVSVEKKLDLHIQLPGGSDIKALYAGNLDSKYLDKELLYSLIDKHPNVDFIFLGSGGANWRRQLNVFFLGEIEHNELLSYLEKSSVLLLIYDVEKYPDQLTNAHKILEYLLSGVVVVGTFFKDYEDKSRLINMGKSRREVEMIFDCVIKDLHYHNREEHKNLRRNYALTNRYAVRLDEIESIIQEFKIKDQNEY